MSDGAQAKRCGWLKNGNPPGDYAKARRCGARTRRDTPCRQPAMPNGRCKMHGGKSSGPRTPEGLERSRWSTWKHGARSAETIANKRQARALCRLLHELMRLAA